MSKNINESADYCRGYKDGYYTAMELCREELTKPFDLRPQQIIIKCSEQNCMINKEMNYKIFHKIWTLAVNKEGYNKRLFQEIETELKKLGFIIKEDKI
jgi:hypothetical protein